MLRAHKIALAPNNAQATHLARACGVARFAYNWALADKQTASERSELCRSLSFFTRGQSPHVNLGCPIIIPFP